MSSYYGELKKGKEEGRGVRRWANGDYMMANGKKVNQKVEAFLNSRMVILMMVNGKKVNLLESLTNFFHELHIIKINLHK